MIAQQLEAALAERYKGRGWAKFFQFRPLTSYEASFNAIDLLAVGLWRKHDKIVAHEIKVDRNDFLRDLKVFNNKHRFALEISHEFYYVCPWGLIEKYEVPEICGLMYADKNMGLRIYKPATLRPFKDISFHLFQGFVQHFGNKVDLSKVPVRYLGKDMTQDDLMRIVEEKKEWSFKRDVEVEVERLTKEKEEKKGGRDLFIREIMDLCYFNYTEEKEAFPRIKKLIEIGMLIKNDYGFRRTLEAARDDFNKLLFLIEEKKQKWTK